METSVKQLKHQFRTVCWMTALTAAILSMNVQADTCYIDGNSRMQMIDGFGFSSAWCGTLSEAKNNALYNTLGMSLLRVRIDDGSNWSPEISNANAAHAAGVKVLGSAWFGPGEWRGKRLDSWGNEQDYLLPQYYDDYANWLKDAVTAHDLDWISPANEPDLGWMAWTSDELRTWIGQYGGTLGAPLLAPESCWFADSYGDPILNDSAAGPNVSIYGGHIYGSGLSVHQNALNKGKHCWMTEHFINGMDDINSCMEIGKEISDCMNCQMSAYIWWWVNDNDTNMNLVMSDGTIHKNGYTMGQFAKWVRPGKQRIASTYNPTSGVYVTAYRNGGVVIVAVNTSGSAVDQQFVLSNLDSTTQFRAYRTSASENMASVGTCNVFGRTFMNRLPAQSVTTFVQSYDNSGATFYENYNYGGAASQTLGAGSYTISQLAAKGMPNDWASSVRISDGYIVTLYENDNFTGMSWTLTADTPEFGSFGANDQASSVVVEKVWGGVYKIVARHSGKAIDVYEGRTDNGTPLVQWPYWGGTNQQWQVTYEGDGEYSIISVHSGKSIDINNWDAYNGAVVQLWDYWGTTNQRFYILPTDSGYYSISPTHAPEFCLDVAGISGDDGALIHLWTWLGGANQQWAFQAP